MRNVFSNANQILPGLWLGNALAAHDTTFLKDNNITVVINCTKDIPFNKEVDTYKYRIPVDDSLKHEDIIKMTNSLESVLNFIEYTYSTKTRNVLIHCYAGVQRSAIVMVSFLYKLRQRENKLETVDFGDYYTKQQNAKWAFAYVISKRPQAFSGGKYINFKKSFEDYFRIQID